MRIRAGSGGGAARRAVLRKGEDTYPVDYKGISFSSCSALQASQQAVPRARPLPGISASVQRSKKNEIISKKVLTNLKKKLYLKKFSLLNFSLFILSYTLLNNFLSILFLQAMMKIGERIRDLRQLSNLTQEELAERANLTKGFISQIERDLTSISLDSLFQILEALDENISDFFRETSKEKIVYGVQDRVAIEKEKIEKFELLVPGSTNRRLEPILLTLLKGEATPKERPHEGEEFGFVLRGRINLRFGREILKLKSGECFYLSAEKEHWLHNTGSKEALILWISSPPSF